MWSTTWWWCGWRIKSSSGLSLVHILSTSSSKSANSPSVFYDFHVKPSSRYSLVHILSNSSSKSAKSPTVVLRFLCETELSLQSRAHFVWSKRATAETDTVQQRPRTATLPEKNIGFCARECFQPWIHTFRIAHTWWCGWHDGATASCDNRSEFGGFLTKLPLIIEYE